MLISSEILREKVEELMNIIRENIRDNSVVQVAERAYLSLLPMDVDSQGSVPILYQAV